MLQGLLKTVYGNRVFSFKNVRADISPGTSTRTSPGTSLGTGPGTSPGFAGVAPDACDSLTLPPSEGGGTERDAAAREEVRTLLSTV